jgi:hypothetical protein
MILCTAIFKLKSMSKSYGRNFESLYEHKTVQNKAIYIKKIGKHKISRGVLGVGSFESVLR